MPIADTNRLKGNYGAAYVSARLSSECLVRPVAAETDVGVDLYCETSKDRADPDKVGLYQLFKKPGFVDIRDIG